MVCPSCGETLLMTERLTVQIDYCPKCRGIWLDRGELEKIIDRVEQELLANRPAAAPQPAQHVQSATPPRAEPPSAYIPPMPVSPSQPQVVVVRQDDDDDYYKHGHKHKKRKHWLGEIFDFD